VRDNNDGKRRIVGIINPGKKGDENDERRRLTGDTNLWPFFRALILVQGKWKELLGKIKINPVEIFFNPFIETLERRYLRND